MNSKVLLTAFFVLLGSIYCSDILAWDDGVTHKDLSEYAAENSVLNKDKGDYLKNIGFNNNIDEKLTWGNNNWNIRNWLREGAKLEDSSGPLSVGYIDGKGRSFNHFHNALKQAPWLDAGLNDWITLPSPLPPYSVNISLSGKSSLLWAQDGPYQNNFHGKDWSWQKTRSYYYLALTSATDSERQEYFAQTFRGLGHQIHLLQDTAVPDHVRNDAHPEDALFKKNPLNGSRYFETWTKEAISSLTRMKTFAPTPVFPNIPMNASRQGLAPITQLYDTDQYDGFNASAGINQGLAEYTNANFFSGDSVFAAERYSTDHRHYFPFPRKTSTDLSDYIAGRKPRETVADDLGHTETGIWISKVSDGEEVRHFVRTSTLTKVAYKLSGESNLFYSTFYRDEKCHEDYAKKLIPRAVGYSAGLLNYFFRGSLDMVADSSGSYRIANLAEEDMSGALSSFRLFYDDADGNRIEIPLTFLDESGNQLTGSAPFYIQAKGTSSFLVQFQPFTQEPSQFILVFKGRLGAEEDAVAGGIVGKIYLVFMPIDPGSRQTLDPVKRYYHLSGLGGNTLNPVATVAELPFALLDDSAYWDQATSSWTRTESVESLGVPVGAGGPQYMAKYWDAPNKRVRFVLNTSYEKEAYRAFNFSPVDPDTGRTIKGIYYVNFTGSPLLNFGAYEPNTGWMEYTGNGLLSILSPSSDPQQRFFSTYRSLNFNDLLVESPNFTVYNFDGSRYESGIPRDPDAPKPAILGADKPNGADYVRVSIPEVFSTYVRPKTYWRPLANLGSSGLNYYRFYSDSSQAYDSREDKCIFEDNNCGNMYDTGQGDSSIKAAYDIPYNFNSRVRVHINDNGLYYEELFINGLLVEASSASADSLKTHYQILAVYKDTALVRKTGYVSEAVTPLEYAYANLLRVVEKQWNWSSGYFIFVKGKRYEVPGTTSVTSRLLTYDYNQPPAGPRVDYLAFETVEDITGYHIDRIFVSETSDGSNVLIAFDEYQYNGGKGLVHQLKYEQSDNGEDKFILFYDIPKSELQNADHEATRVGRKLLLFRGDGTFKGGIEDPLGLNLTIGSMGILN